MGSSNEHIVDIEQISTSIEKELEILHPLSDECCIYRVPNILRRSNEEAYTPQEVSIGPLHHGRPELKPMEEIKRRYLQEFLLLSNSTMSLKEYVKFIEERETKLRNCYAETIEMNSEDLVKMILIDSAFLIMVFLKFSCKELQTGNDRLFSKPWKEFDVRYDMILLENQLPFFILKDLFDVSDIRNKLQLEGLSLLKLTHEFLKIKWKSWVTDEVSEEHNFSQVHHILDFLRICRRPSTKQIESKLSKQIALHAPSATQLHQAGVKFELSPSKNKFDIQFEHGILKIPRLRVTKRTEFYLRNLQAFEQCHCNDDNRYTSDYIAFITMLVRTPKDVEVLAQSGVAQNRLRNDDTMSSLLNNLGTGNFVSRTRFHFSDIVEELNKYCENSLHKWKATLKQDYFNTPWAGISVATAAILLLLTLIQTRSISSYFSEMEISGRTSTQQIKTINDVSLDIYQLAKSVRSELEILHPLSDDCCIYRVPKRLRQLNEKTYTPRAVSIRPLHHGKPELRPMEEHKTRYNDFLEWSEKDLEDYIELVKDREIRLRNCYSETIGLSSEDFVRIILLDSAFIAMVLLKHSLKEFGGKKDRIFSKPRMIGDVRFHILLLENQLPFFILDDLFKLCNISHHEGHQQLSMILLTHKFFSDTFGSWVSKC